jgi:hypothetical protein
MKIISGSHSIAKRINQRPKRPGRRSLLTNLGRDTLIESMPASASFAKLISMALKVLATISVAWFMKICWYCVPYVVSKLRENADQVL